MFQEAHNFRVNQQFGDKKIPWVYIKGKKIESPAFEYPILFGVEMEYEVVCPDSIVGKDARRLYRPTIANQIEPTFSNFAIIKHDGSMDNGVEIVSVPMSHDAHSEQWKPFFEIASKSGLAVRRTCGMHVHVSKELLTQLQIGKILCFLHDKNNLDFIKLIAGRNKPIYTGEHGCYTDLTPKKISDVKRFRERYSALNLRGVETIEFRFFKSTLDLDRMLANLEFCDALVRFTWPGTGVGIQEMKKHGVKAFASFILNNRKRFQYLANFLNKNGYISWKDGKKIVTIPKKVEEVVPKLKQSTNSLPPNLHDYLIDIETDNSIDDIVYFPTFHGTAS